MENVQSETTEKMSEQKDLAIFVNTRAKDWDKERISFEEVVILAFGSYSDNPNIVYTVTYSKGPEGHREGSLTKGEDVKVKEGMIFNVTESNKS